MVALNVWVACSACSRWVESGTTLPFKFCIGLLDLVSDALLVTDLFQSRLFFLDVLLALLLVDLLLQFDLHSSPLLLFLLRHHCLLVTTSEDAPLLLQFQVQTAVSYSSSCHDAQVRLSLNGRVYRLTLCLLIRWSVFLLRLRTRLVVFRWLGRVLRLRHVLRHLLRRRLLLIRRILHLVASRRELL